MTTFRYRSTEKSQETMKFANVLDFESTMMIESTIRFRCCDLASSLMMELPETKARRQGNLTSRPTVAAHWHSNVFYCPHTSLSDQ
jgi:hypothetical protein